MTISPLALALLSLDMRMLKNEERLAELSREYLAAIKNGGGVEQLAGEIRKLLSQQDAIEEVFGEAEKRKFPLYSITGGKT